jgi:hypothetical protein
MKQRKESTLMFAICVDNSGYPASLELLKVYRVLPDDDAATDGDLRIIDESDEDYLYPASYFVLIDLPQDTERILADSFSRSLQPAAYP